MANINDFKAKLAGGGARANQFKVTMPFPGYAQVGGEIEELAFLCRATSLPGMQVPSFGVPFRGRNIKIAGDRTFEDWSVTIINDSEFSAMSSLEAWQQDIQELDSGVGMASNDYLLSRAFVEQLGKDDAVLARYEFFNMYPKNIAAIELNYETVDALEEFTVDFTYSHWERVK